MNYIARHWRGELSLPVSFWGNWLGVTLLFGAAGLVIIEFELVSLDSPRTLAAGFLFLSLFVITATVWQVVGIWRAARKYIRVHAGRLKRLWGAAAIGVAAIVAVSSAYDLAARLLPQAVITGLIAFDYNLYGNYRISLAPGGEELRIMGGFGIGLAEDVRAQLDRSPAVRRISLTSPGGNIEEARKLARLIEARGLDTYTAKSCASACILAYAAGRRRLIGQEGKLGFHQYYFPGILREQARAEEEKGETYLLSRGITPAFVAKVHRALPRNMWIPGHEELLAARFVTGYHQEREAEQE